MLAPSLAAAEVATADDETQEGAGIGGRGRRPACVGPHAPARIAEHRNKVLHAGGGWSPERGGGGAGSTPSKSTPAEPPLSAGGAAGVVAGRDGGGLSGAAPAPRGEPCSLGTFPWLERLPHFRPIEVLQQQAFDPEAPQVHVDYRRQFHSAAPVPGIRRAAARGGKQPGWKETATGEKYFVNSSGKQVRMGKARTGEGLKGSLRGSGAGKRKGAKRKARKSRKPRKKPRS